MVDIVMITNTGIFDETRCSLNFYAEHEQIVLCTNSGVDWNNGERLAEHRLQAVKESTADWVFLLDHDDLLVRPLFQLILPDMVEYVLFPFYDTRDRFKSIMSCGFQRAFGFHMIIAKREAAIAALQYVCDGGFYRDDTAYLTWLVENTNGTFCSDAIARKVGDHLPIEVPELREVMKQECNDIWKSRLTELRKKVLFDIKNL